MIIHADEVMPMLVATAPSFAERWQALQHDPMHVEDDGTRFHYLDAGEFSRHLVGLLRRSTHAELHNAFAVLETLHVDGDDYVRELATIGYLEGIQNTCSHATDVSDTDFEAYLGPESRRWWRGLDEFWSGRSPVVRPPESGS